MLRATGHGMTKCAPVDLLVSADVQSNSLGRACLEAGLSMRHAPHGRVLQTLETQRVGAVLLPATEAGFELLGELRADERWEMLPVLLVVDTDAALQRESPWTPGPEELIFEPVGARELQARLGASAGRHRQQADARKRLAETSSQLEESRRQMEQAQKMESIGRLAGGVAHDFNNLLTSIISFSRFVMDDLVPGDPRRADLSEVLKAADSASRLTSQLLAFSRQRPVDPVPVELNEALTNIHGVLRRTVGEHVELVLVPSERRQTVSFDPGQLDQVIMNLAVNARDAMPEGGTLTLTAETMFVKEHPELPPGRYARLRVSDNGSGMPPDVMAQIFEPFYSTKGERGTGLGLSTVYGIVKQAKGHIEVESTPGAGTTFTIQLPLVRTVRRRRTTSRMSAPQKMPPGGVALVVEDQPAILRTMNRSLGAAGFTVLEAHSAEEALALVDDLDAKVDLLVTDVVLPGLSGVKLAGRLRDGQPGLRVLVCSGYMGQDGTDSIPTNDGITAFLPKPFTGPQLLSKVGRLFV